MKYILRNHKNQAGKYANQFHGAYVKIFKILSQGSLGLVEEYWEESFEPMPGSQDWMLEVGGGNIEADKLEKILDIKTVEEYCSWKLSQNDSAYDKELSDSDGYSLGVSK